MLNFYNFLESSRWQINFQDPATPIAGRIIEIHHHVFFFLLVVLIFVIWMLYRILNTFWAVIPENTHTFNSKYNFNNNPIVSLEGYNDSYDKLLCNNKEKLIFKWNRSKKIRNFLEI